VLEGGFDRYDQFFFIPIGANEVLTEIWRCRVAALFLDTGLLKPQFARTLLSWCHSHRYQLTATGAVLPTLPSSWGESPN
jgi:hypothetical protein